MLLAFPEGGHIASDCSDPQILWRLNIGTWWAVLSCELQDQGPVTPSDPQKCIGLGQSLVLLQYGWLMISFSTVSLLTSHMNKQRTQVFDNLPIFCPGCHLQPLFWSLKKVNAPACSKFWAWVLMGSCLVPFGVVAPNSLQAGAFTFLKNQTMAANGTLNRKLVDCCIPVCAAC